MSTETKAVRAKFEVKLGAATREAFGRTLLELGRENKDVVVVDADLSKSTMTTYFAKEFPGRFFSCGIAEANMIGVGTHSGISIGEDGPSQMSVEEIALACSLAGFVVLAPA